MTNPLINLLPDLISSTKIREKLQISRSTFWRIRKDPNFPTPMVLFGTVERWKIEEIEEFLKSRTHK